MKNLIIAIALLIAAPCLAEEEWVPLFDGDSLNGWERKGGVAEYSVEDECIVGETRFGTPNTFLCTEQHYGDFVLEYEFKVDPKLNSGVQIRSNSDPDFKDGRVHGYQVEIDPSDRAWTAGVYDEGRRGWLNDLKENEAARNAFKQNEWNHVRVEAIGHSIKTWLNGVPAADLEDGMTARGFIGLQVHAVSTPEPLQVRWRNLRIREVPLERTFDLMNNGETPYPAGSVMTMIVEDAHAPPEGLMIQIGEGMYRVPSLKTDEGVLLYLPIIATIPPGKSMRVKLRSYDPESDAKAILIPPPAGIELQKIETESGG